MKTNIKQNGNILVVNVRGHLTVNDADRLKAICGERLKKQKILFNLKELSFVGSSGVSVFHETLSALKKRNVLKMCCVSSEFKRVFDNEAPPFLIYQNEREALLSFQSPPAPPNAEPPTRSF